MHVADCGSVQLQKRKSLRYIHFLDIEYFGSSQSGPDLQTLLLEQAPPSLELLGFGSKLRWVTASSAGEELEPWSTSEVWFRDVAKFGKRNEDWEWLLRHHDDALYGMFAIFAHFRHGVDSGLDEKRKGRGLADF